MTTDTRPGGNLLENLVSINVGIVNLSIGNIAILSKESSLCLHCTAR